MAESPYKNQDQNDWKKITEKLINDYPLTLDEILEISLISWDKLWNTNVGNVIKLIDVELPATVVGYFFQKIFAHELSSRYPDEWQGEKNKSDKDIVNLSDKKFSTEMKSSGQLGYKVFGNRSYCQKSDTPSKAKSGYYITINFNKHILTLISLGWIDQDDWRCQDAESGQAATLPPEVYTHKLVPIHGKYQLSSPIGLLNGVGKSKVESLKAKGVITFKDIILKSDSDREIYTIYNKNKDLLDFLKSL